MKPMFRYFSGAMRRLPAIRRAPAAFFILVLAASCYAALSAYSGGRASNSATAAVQRPENIEAELITVLPTGFEPDEIVRPAGRFLLAIDNQSGLRQLVIRLDQEGSPRVADVRLRRKTEVTRVLDLPAGLYQVTEASHPGWILRLRLTAR